MVSRQQYYLDTGTDILTTGADITRFVIREMAKEGITQFRPREVTNRIKNIPNLNREYNEKNTVANMHYLCVNSKSADSYPSSTRDFLYWVKRGIFEIYSPEKHDGATRQDDSLPNDLADIDRLKREKQIDETMAAVLICARKGQGRFRNDVSAWCPVCPISGVDNKRLLIASHIKPWSKSSNEERLDGYNGFMFAPHIDWLFDRGFISFDEEGKILISPQLDDKNWQALNISPDIQLKKLPEKTKEYIQHHRENVYLHD